MNDRQVIYTMQRIGGLLFRRLHGNLSEGEQDTLDNWLYKQDQATRQFFVESTDWDNIQLALQEMYEFDVDAAFADVQKKIQAELMAQPNPGVALVEHQTVRIYRWVAIAAMILLIFGSVGIYLSSKKDAVVAVAPIAERFKNEVAPGGTKAILQLANGSQFDLDGASNGQLAKEGSISISKNAAGELSYNVGNDKSESISYNVISTPRGGQYQVTLTDGTKVWLNAASSLRFPVSFVGSERSVELKGEGYFEVAKSSIKPFRVIVTGTDEKKSLEIDVLGTAFDVMAYSDEAEQQTTLINGAVNVRVSDKSVTLKPNEQVKIRYNASGSISNLQPAVINPQEVISWKDGYFQLKDSSIEEIMRQAARWYDIDVAYDAKIDKRFVGTIPRRVNLTTLLKILESTGWVHFTINGKKVTVIK